jgi:hypothetical protein
VFLGVVDEVELAGGSALGGEERGRLRSVLRPVIDHVHQHLPHGHPSVDVSDEAVGHGGQSRIDHSPLDSLVFLSSLKVAAKRWENGSPSRQRLHSPPPMLIS